MSLLTTFHQHLIRLEWAAQSHHGLVQNKIWRLEIELGGIQRSEYKNIISVYCSAVCLDLIKLMVISVEHAKWVLKIFFFISVWNDVLKLLFSIPPPKKKKTTHTKTRESGNQGKYQIQISLKTWNLLRWLLSVLLAWSSGPWLPTFFLTTLLLVVTAE